MQLALAQLGATASGPDRFPDTPDRSAGPAVLVHEVLPGRDDPRRVATQLAHVSEDDIVGVTPQRAGERLETRLRHGHHHRLTDTYSLGDKRDDLGQEVVVAVVEQRLVALARLRAG